MTVLVLGRGFLGSAIAAALGSEARLASHAQATDPRLLEGVRCVVWAGRHPALGTPAWSLAHDGEPLFARRAAERGIAFVSLGTRKVYASSPRPLREDDPLGPADLYGRHKLALEEALSRVPGLALTRLRLANVFGFERDLRRNSFMTRLLDTLARTGEVRFDVSPFTVRDFLPIEEAAAWVAALAREPPGGVVNLGSGVPSPIGRLALRVIEGFGRGRLVIEDPRERDAFVLDVGRLRALLPQAKVDAARIEAAAFALGRRLAAAG
ncbi:MAG: NAD(P)-dependent oxidoreductase [Geminicoccaceae bacterium]|nr:NAD(P)-dependent oxidoreductase [Geminicoccaceae bacterium]MDW8341770.1 NAD(P)-dependent oxidoreductase [Geminicoccaceae bacterium]